MTERDGSHDFDFLWGDWDFHLRRLLRPLSGSDDWTEYDGILRCRPLCGGQANVDEVMVDNPNDRSRIEGVTLRLYNPETHEWSLFWANAKTGSLAASPQRGKFTGGRGEFLDRDTYNGKPIIVRYVWSDITPNSAHFEQSFSADEGGTWEANWITDQTRRKSSEIVSGRSH
jgi:hypothetical protein